MHPLHSSGRLALVVVMSLAIAVLVPGSCRAQDEVHFQGSVEVPDVVRYLQLPSRMVNELQLPPARHTVVLEDGLIEFFTQLLSSQDVDLRIEAARSLDRIARGNHGDIAPAINALTKLVDAENRHLRLAAARALAAADARQAAAALVEFCQHADDRSRMQIEPALVRWQADEAVEMWRSRLDESGSSGLSLELACHGLKSVAAADASELVLRLLLNPNTPFAARRAAAEALASLDPGTARTTASTFGEGSVRDRLLAVALLAGPQAEARQELVRYCGDPANAVAADAWRRLETLQAELLQPELDAGLQHPDAEVRQAAIRVIDRFPGRENCDRLVERFSDEHIAVRNHARVVLLKHAQSDPALKEHAVTILEPALRGNWQSAEQAVVAAAVLDQPQFAALCVPLLKHERPEVFVTAAWLIHLYPDALIMQEVDAVAQEKLQVVSNAPVTVQDNVGAQLSFLFQTAGYLDYKPMLPLCTAQFSKTTGVDRSGRAGAMWAIGMLNRDQPVADLVPKLVERLNDRDSIVNPEFDLVRRMAAMSLGRMKAAPTISDLRYAYGFDAPDSLIPEAVRWGLGRMDQEVPPMRKLSDTTTPVGGWRISPLKSK